MDRIKFVIVAAMLAGILLTACEQAAPFSNVPTPTAVLSTDLPDNDTGGGKGPQNATYMIDGKPVPLVNGMAEEELAPGSASKKVTKYWGNAVELDLNSDGMLDSAFLLTEEGGGSGTFVYVAAALRQGDGYQGTNAIFLGDRIAPQSTTVDPDNPVQFVVTYLDRKASEPMSAQPSVEVSRTFKYENGSLVEVGIPPTQTP